jgi:hypothetical protein
VYLKADELMPLVEFAHMGDDELIQSPALPLPDTSEAYGRRRLALSPLHALRASGLRKEKEQTANETEVREAECQY